MYDTRYDTIRNDTRYHERNAARNDHHSLSRFVSYWSLKYKLINRISIVNEPNSRLFCFPWWCTSNQLFCVFLTSTERKTTTIYKVRLFLLIVPKRVTTLKVNELAFFKKHCLIFIILSSYMYILYFKIKDIKILCHKFVFYSLFFFLSSGL